MRLLDPHMYGLSHGLCTSGEREGDLSPCRSVGEGLQLPCPSTSERGDE